MHNISYRKQILIQTEQSLYERNIYLIRIFTEFQKFSILIGFFYTNWLNMI